MRAQQRRPRPEVVLLDDVFRLYGAQAVGEGTPERLPDRLRRPAHPGQQLNLNNQDEPLN
jgi:hypothetical protein